MKAFFIKFKENSNNKNQNTETLKIQQKSSNGFNFMRSPRVFLVFFIGFHWLSLIKFFSFSPTIFKFYKFFTLFLLASSAFLQYSRNILILYFFFLYYFEWANDVFTSKSNFNNNRQRLRFHFRFYATNAFNTRFSCSLYTNILFFWQFIYIQF